MELSSNTLDLKDRKLSFYARNSFLIHVMLCGLCVYLTYYFGEALEERKRLNLKLVESSVRVDIVAMPKMTVKELKALEKIAARSKSAALEEEPATTPKVEEVPSKGPEFLKKTKKLSFSEMMKRYSKKKLPKNKKAKQAKKKSGGSVAKKSKGLSSKERLALANLVKEGNKLRAGTLLTGDGVGEHEQGVFVDYINRVREWVKPQWKLPSYLLDKELNCRIRIFINSKGKLLQAEVFESSGNTEYDAKALAAVKASAPFPKSAREIKSRVVSGDIVLGFPL